MGDSAADEGQWNSYSLFKVFFFSFEMKKNKTMCRKENKETFTMTEAEDMESKKCAFSLTCNKTVSMVQRNKSLRQLKWHWAWHGQLLISAWFHMCKEEVGGWWTDSECKMSQTLFQLQMTGSRQMASFMQSHKRRVKGRRQKRGAHTPPFTP